MGKLEGSKGVSRRRLFGSVAAAGMAAGLAGAAPADEEESKALPNFKFDIENQKGWVGEGGSAKEATVAEFPISQSIAGVSMRLQPGAMRELHWHSLAAEWAYMLEGRCRVTVISPEGQAEVADFGPGRYVVFSARPRACAARAGSGRMPFSAGLRQRPLFRIRYV